MEEVATDAGVAQRWIGLCTGGRAISLSCSRLGTADDRWSLVASPCSSRTATPGQATPVLRRIKDRVHQKWNCAIAEVGDETLWTQRWLASWWCPIQRGYTQSQVQKILQFIDDLSVCAADRRRARLHRLRRMDRSNAGRAEYEALGAGRAIRRAKTPPKLSPPKLSEPADYPWTRRIVVAVAPTSTSGRIGRAVVGEAVRSSGEPADRARLI